MKPPSHIIASEILYITLSETLTDPFAEKILVFLQDSLIRICREILEFEPAEKANYTSTKNGSQSLSFVRKFYQYCPVQYILEIYVTHYQTNELIQADSLIYVDYLTQHQIHYNPNNEERPHSGKYCYSKTPMQTFLDTKHIALEKNNESMYNKSISDSQVM